ncbi:hypothetical protein [Escherichia coli]|uniref:hypothetical protein n=1 Tax=Escherichia coli TaxID=562 RepID=UPI001B3576EC|nr:hypothetical protein [Escherichia coli]
MMQFNGKVSKVGLVFENCEFIEIDVKNVLWMHIADEKTLCSRFSNGLTISTGIGEFGIALRSDTPSDFMDNSTLLDRLKMRDVTHVYLYDTNGVEQRYVVEWANYNISDQYSVNQRVQLTPGGNIVFVSSTGKLISVDDANIDLFTSYN